MPSASLAALWSRGPRDREQSFAGALGLQREVAAEETRARQTPQEEMRVRDRGFFAAAVAGGARIGSGALRADAQGAALIDVRQAAAARPD
jgi:hypothetical protein